MKKTILGTALSVILSVSPAYAAGDTGSIQVLRDALFGAGVGAISAEVSGGKAGMGALIGAGSNVIGQALLGILMGTSSQAQPVYSQPVYSQPVYTQPTYSQTVTYQQPVYQPAPRQTRTVYYETPAVYSQPAPVYYSPTYEDPNKRIIKQGLIGACVGAISAEASGGKAGPGALIGAGTNVIGSALLELLTA